MSTAFHRAEVQNLRKEKGDAAVRKFKVPEHRSFAESYHEHMLGDAEEPKPSTHGISENKALEIRAMLHAAHGTSIPVGRSVGYAGTGKAVSRTPALQAGAKGGQFYVTATGRKVYKSS